MKICPGRGVSNIGRLTAALCFLLLAAPGRADNIFDDNWTPPKRTEKAPAADSTAKPGSPEKSTPPAVTPAAKEAPPGIPIPAQPTEVAPARRAIPAKPDQDRSRKLMKEVFAKQLSDHSATARRKLAQELLSEAGKTTDNPVDQFVLLSGAVQAATEAGSMPLCFEAADGMARTFDVDGLAVRTEAAMKIPFAGDSPEKAAENVRAGMELLDQLAEAGDFVAATRLGALLQRASANNANQKSLMQQRVKEIADLRVAHDRFALQQERLKASPADPSANLAVGGYYCFVKNRWDLGLPFLAKGSNAAVKAAVAVEQAHPKSRDQLIAAGDAWWDAAEKEPASAPGHGAMRRHAAYFYGQAMEGGGVTGLSRTRIEKRIELAGKIEAPAGSAVAKQQSVLLWRGGKAEEETYKLIAEGRVRVVNKAETVAILSDPATYASCTIIAFSTNKWREMAAEDITENIQKSLQDFVRNGGDLIMFEQYAMTNMSIIDTMFGIKTNGGPTGALVEDAELNTKLQEAGYNDLMLQSLHFYNTYNKLPEGTRILLRGADAKHSPTAVVVPFGKGRLILVGTTWDKLEEKVNQAILQVIYRYKTPKP